MWFCIPIGKAKRIFLFQKSFFDKNTPIILCGVMAFLFGRKCL